MSRGNTRSSRGVSQSTVWTIIAVAVVAAIALSLTAVAFIKSRQQVSPASQARALDVSSFPTSTPETPKQVQPKDVLPRLDDEARPFNIVVFGDSTGIARRGWQVLLTEHLAEEHNRTALLHPWDAAEGADAYQAQNWNIASGENSAIDVYNASMPGSNSTYPMTRLDKMVPIPGEAVDMVFVNYGHNENLQNRVRDQSALMEEATKRYPNAAVISFLQNPERKGTPRASAVRDGNYYWKRWLTGNGYAFVDVQSAFDAKPDLNALLASDGPYHPNNDGYKVWADTLTEYLDQQR